MDSQDFDLTSKHWWKFCKIQHESRVLNTQRQLWSAPPCTGPTSNSLAVFVGCFTRPAILRNYLQMQRKVLSQRLAKKVTQNIPILTGGRRLLQGSMAEAETFGNNTLWFFWQGWSGIFHSNYRDRTLNHMAIIPNKGSWITEQLHCHLCPGRMLLLHSGATFPEGTSIEFWCHCTWLAGFEK